MKLVGCPHCGHRHIVTSPIPADVVVVLPCPSCQEFVVFYRNQILGMKRDILDASEPGREKEQIADALSAYLATDPPDDIAPIIGREMLSSRLDEESDEDEFIEDDSETDDDGRESPALDAESGDPAKRITRPITSHEIVTFIESELPRIDDPGYFKRTFQG